MQCFVLMALFLMTSASHGQVKPEDHPDIHLITIDSVLQTTHYTYALTTEKDLNKVWVALPGKNIKPGETYYYHKGVEMKNFKSTELGRNFESVLFLSGLIDPDELNLKKGTGTESKREAPKRLILPVENGVSITELFRNKEKYAGKTVRIRGEVVRYNAGIMNRNWIHLMDYSTDSKNLDFTATSKMKTTLGEIIVMEGKITLNKNYGAGYFYEVIMEDGIIFQE